MTPITPKSPEILLKEFNEIWDNSLPYQGPDIDDRWLNEAFASLLVWSAKEATKSLDAVVPRNFNSSRGWFSGVGEHEKAVIALAESLRQKDV